MDIINRLKQDVMLKDIVAGEIADIKLDAKVIRLDTVLHLNE